MRGEHRPILDIVFVTGHLASNARKASMIFMADAAAAAGHSVSVVTVGYSRLRPAPAVRVNEWTSISEKMRSFVWEPLFHPVNLRRASLNKMTTRLFQAYPRLLPRHVWSAFDAADVIVVESGAALLLVREIRQRNPSSRIVYSVSDRLITINAHPALVACERDVLGLFDLIRVPAEVMVDDYSGYPVKHIPHGLDKSYLSAVRTNPYSQKKGNIISIGDMLFDADVVTALASAFPANTFHLFGRRARLPVKRRNVREHGEVPFADLVPYLQHADVGLAPYRAGENASYLSQSSLKIIQYSYCKLPIVAPRFACATAASHLFAYDPQFVETAVTSMRGALRCPRESITVHVSDWAEVMRTVIGQHL